MCGFRYDNAQEWVCPNIMMPPVLERCRAAFDEFCVRARPRHTPEWQPVFSECRVELYFNKKKVSITCDAVVATILSLFETPETVIKQSDIESRTGVKGLLLSAVMDQLCTKRPREGMSTGLLQVFGSCHLEAVIYAAYFTIYLMPLLRLTKTKILRTDFTRSEWHIADRLYTGR